MATDPLREQLAKLLDWTEAHAGFDRAVAAMPASLQGAVPPGFEHSAWQILEHLRIAQEDIYDFSVNAGYIAMVWPDDYWPASPQPPGAEAWEGSVAAYRDDRAKLQALARNADIDLLARIPHGDGQTYLREILLVADHGAYHVGQLVALRKALGCWPQA
ncbi:MAG: DinB family protein [Vicinamibacterales bacterium]